MVTVAIHLKHCVECGSPGLYRLSEIEALVGTGRLYLKGTSQERYVDCRDRAEADLLALNLNLMDGVQARICGG